MNEFSDNSAASLTTIDMTIASDLPSALSFAAPVW
jgi:hypothetical protein